MADGLIITSGSLPSPAVESTSKTHYYPNATATLQLNRFVPVSLNPNSILVRARRGVPSGTNISCRVFDVTGTPVLVVNPTITIDTIVSFANFAFPISASLVGFPAFAIWTVELEITNVDLAGFVICYKPVFPLLLNSNLTSPDCQTTTIIS